jgi:hypothetical protein
LERRVVGEEFGDEIDSSLGDVACCAKEVD